MKPHNKAGNSLMREQLRKDKLRKVLIFIIIVISSGLGFCCWFFLTRCGHAECYYNQYPFVEMFLFGFVGWLTSISLIKK